MIEALADKLPTTYNTQEIIDIINKDLEETKPDDVIKYLTKWSVAIALRNVKDNTGGPFGALLYNRQTGKVVATGANHVVPEKNPSRHAEMVTFDDFLERTGNCDMEDLILVTSCECCPQCYSTAISCGISEVYFGATAERAAKSQFSDAEMWHFMDRGYDFNAHHISYNPEAARFAHLLKDNDVVLVLPGEQIITVKSGEQGLGFGQLPIIRAVLQGIKETGRVFDLPEGSMILSRLKPHPTSVCCSHWANVGFDHERSKTVFPTSKKPHLLYQHPHDSEQILRAPGGRSMTMEYVAMAVANAEMRAQIAKKVALQPGICDTPFNEFDRMVGQGTQELY